MTHDRRLSRRAGLHRGVSRPRLVGRQWLNLRVKSRVGEVACGRQGSDFEDLKVLRTTATAKFWKSLENTGIGQTEKDRSNDAVGQSRVGGDHAGGEHCGTAVA